MNGLANAWRLLATTCCLWAALAGVASADEVPDPVVVGPVPATAPGDPSRDYVYFTPQEDLAQYGYVEEEFFFEGTASSYDTSAGGDGVVVSSGHPYRTRMVVRRPIRQARFNGTVLLEWQNVTAGYEIDAHWAPSWQHFVRKGYAWVGVSAQRVGVHGYDDVAPEENNGLRAWSPSRYGSLDVTDGGAVMDDSLSYDIFSQAAKAVQSPVGVDPMGGLRVRDVLAVGASQSAGRLSVYHNAVHPLHEVVDGFYLLVGGRGLRTDLDVKVFQYLSETDVGFVGPSRRMEDSDTFRSWEVAGTGHSSYVSAEYRTPLVLRDFGTQPFPPDCDQPPYTRTRSHYVINRQYDLLVRWIRWDIPPPRAPKIEFTTDTEVPTIARDEFGIAQGGIRLPEVEVPTALNSGVNSGATFCVLYGTYQPFTEETLSSLYPSRFGYLRDVTRVARRNARDGYVSDLAAWLMSFQALAEDVPPGQ